MKITGKNLIAGRQSSEGKQTFKAFNPATLKELPENFYPATEHEVDLALQEAQTAYEQYKTVSGQQKSKLLRAIAENIIEMGDELVQRVMQESALPEARVKGERGRTVNQLHMFADLLDEGSWVEASIDTAQPDRQPVPKPDLRRMLLPIGPVVVFGASNFPLAFSTAGGDTASALAAGNPVIVKGHESHPGTNEMVAKAISKAIAECNLPAGIFSALNGKGPSVGQMLIKHPQVKAVAFTGSFRGGKALFDAAAGREEPIPVFAEMGSVNPIFLMPEKLKQEPTELANAIAGSVKLGSGQFCTNPGICVAVKDKSLNSLTDALNTAFSSERSSSMLNKGIHANYEQKKRQLLNHKDVQLKSEYKGQLSDELDARPAWAEVPAQAFVKNPELHEEIFGPFTLLVVCKDLSEMEKVARAVKGQLTVTIHATENELAANNNLIQILKEKAGRLLFGGVPTGVEVCNSMQHGGPYPATTDSRFTSVGTQAIKRFVRPVSFQNWPDRFLPEELQNSNPLKIWRLVNNHFSQETTG